MYSSPSVAYPGRLGWARSPHGTHRVWERGETSLKGCQGRVCSGELQVSPRARGQRDRTRRQLCAEILLTGPLRSSGHSRRPGQWRPSGRRRATVCPRGEDHVITSCLESWALEITKSRLPFIGFILVFKFSTALLSGTRQTTASDSLGCATGLGRSEMREVESG